MKQFISSSVLINLIQFRKTLNGYIAKVSDLSLPICERIHYCDKGLALYKDVAGIYDMSNPDDEEFFNSTKEDLIAVLDMNAKDVTAETPVNLVKEKLAVLSYGLTTQTKHTKANYSTEFRLKACKEAICLLEEIINGSPRIYVRLYLISKGDDDPAKVNLETIESDALAMFTTALSKYTNMAAALEKIIALY